LIVYVVSVKDPQTSKSTELRTLAQSYTAKAEEWESIGGSSKKY